MQPREHSSIPALVPPLAPGWRGHPLGSILALYPTGPRDVPGGVRALGQDGLRSSVPCPRRGRCCSCGHTAAAGVQPGPGHSSWEPQPGWREAEAHGQGPAAAESPVPEQLALRVLLSPSHPPWFSRRCGGVRAAAGPCPVWPVTHQQGHRGGA